MPKKPPLTYRIFLDGEPVDEMPEWAKIKLGEKMGQAVKDYYETHFDKWIEFCDKVAESGREKEFFQV